MPKGLNNVHESAAKGYEDALPEYRNNPQFPKYNLYAEQWSGSSFTRPRVSNKSTWTYKRWPSAAHDATARYERPAEAPPSEADWESIRGQKTIDPNPGRWRPFDAAALPEKTDFLRGLRAFAGHGAPDANAGLCVYVYTANASMDHACMSSADGEFLIVPQSGTLHVQTELGLLDVHPKQICVLPRGVKFSIRISAPRATGYAVEVFNEGGFRLPELGVLGANALAAPVDFIYPDAHFDKDEEGALWTVWLKSNGVYFRAANVPQSPFDVVAWRGNFSPYKYDLTRFRIVNTVSYDHVDPSVFTVLTVPTETPGVAALDFVLFPPRWLVAEDTFRPPYFHRNVMAEFMGLIDGVYDGKTSRGGFVPGGYSLHNRWQPHGPDRAAYNLATNKEKPLVPFKTHGLAFMFETSYPLVTAAWTRAGPERETEYQNIWRGFEKAKL